MQSESSKGATGRRVLEIDLVRHTIVKNLDNVYSIKDIQGLLSLYALGFLPREDLKDHLARSVAKALGVPCESEHIRLDVPQWFDPNTSEYIPKLVYSTACTGVHVLRSVNAVGCLSTRQVQECLWNASFTGVDTEIIQKLVEVFHGDVFVQDPNGRNAIIHAARGGHVEIMRLLVETYRVAPHAARDYNEWTPLIHASNHGHVECVRFLLDMNQDHTDDTNMYGDTALMAAAQRGYNNIIRLLIEHGRASVNRRNFAGKTSLMFASENGHHATVDLLMNTYGALLDETDKSGQTALAMASSRGHMATVACLLKASAMTPVQHNSFPSESFKVSIGSSSRCRAR